MSARTCGQRGAVVARLDAEMAYRLKAHESVGKGLKRIVTDELRSAIRLLDRAGDPGDSIHEVRKSIKKVRALLRLVGDQIKVDRVITQLRHAAHLLSPLRDADVLVESSEALCSQKGSRSLNGVCSALSLRLKQEQARLSQQSKRSNTLGQVMRDIRGALRTVQSWRWKRVKWPDLIAETRRAYKKTRRDMRRLQIAATDDTFHEWRKRVKTLWYGLRLVERRSAAAQQLGSLKRLGTALGDDHNLAVLRTKLGPNNHGNRDDGSGAFIEDLIVRRQRRLRRQALKVGARLLSDPPKHFEKRLAEPR